MVSRPQGAPGCLLVSTPCFVNFFFAVIVEIPIVLAPLGWPNINIVTCLLTPLVALWRSQYQAMDVSLQGSRRSCKTPHCHHHYQFHHHCLYCPPCRHCKKWKTLAEIIVHECNRVPPRSCVKKNHPHDVGQWSRELLGLEPQPRIRSWADLGGRRCYFVKSKHLLHHPHH